MAQGSAWPQFESGCSILAFRSGSTPQLDLPLDGISFGVAFGLGWAGCFMLVCHSG